MPLTTHTTDSLPYIDPPPSPHSLTAATTEIQSSLKASGISTTTPLHPSLPALPPPSFSPLILKELDRLSAHPSSAPDHSARKMQGGVDMSRYAALPTLPPPPPSTSTSTSSDSSQQASQALRQSRINATYLRLRNEQLELLERYGRNSWVLGNDTLEGILREKEKKLVERRGMVEEVNRGRKAGQLGGGGKGGVLGGGGGGGGEDGVLGLERRWRDGVGRGIEVGVAVREVEERVRTGG